MKESRIPSDVPNFARSRLARIPVFGEVRWFAVGEPVPRLHHIDSRVQAIPINNLRRMASRKARE